MVPRAAGAEQAMASGALISLYKWTELKVGMEISYTAFRMRSS